MYPAQMICLDPADHERWFPTQIGVAEFCDYVDLEWFNGQVVGVCESADFFILEDGLEKTFELMDILI